MKDRIDLMIQVVKETLASKVNLRDFSEKGVIKTAYGPIEIDGEPVDVIVSIEKQPDIYDNLTVRDLKAMSEYFCIERDEKTGITTLHFEVEE